MTLREAAIQALEALIPLANAGCPNERECLTDEDHERAAAAVEALEQALAEPRPIQECYGDCPTNPQTCPNPCNFEGRPKPEKNPFGDDAERYARKLHEWRESCKALFTAPTPRKPEPSAVKHMMRWVDALKRLSDDGQHMNIPGLSSGACWELVAELEQFIKSTAPTPRKPLTDEELKPLIQKTMMYYGHNPDHWTVTSGAGFCILARAIERAHGIGDSNGS